MSRSPAAKIETAERRARVIELRRGGLTFAEIGHECGFSTQRAHEVYLEALKAIPAREVDQYRAEALDIIHAAIEDLLPIARNHTQPRTSVEAWSQLRAWVERLAKTIGFDASAKIDATVTDATRQNEAFHQLMLEAAGVAAAVEQTPPPAE